MFGMAKSVMTKSNFPTSNIASASLPLLAVSTTCPSKVSIILTASQTNGSSSTTKILRCGKAGALIGSKNQPNPMLFPQNCQHFFKRSIHRNNRAIGCVQSQRASGSVLHFFRVCVGEKNED